MSLFLKLALCVVAITICLMVPMALNSAPSDIYPGITWDTATPSEMGFNEAEFAAALAALPDKSIVIRNGYVVGTKGNVSSTGYVWSVSKSLISLMYARQLQLGTVSYDATVPGSDFPSSPLATYRQFLNMTSDFGLSPHSPGNHYAYNNGSYHHLGENLKGNFFPGRTHVQMLQESFVAQLGFEDALGYNTSGYMSGWDGGWSMSARDLARVGYLVLRNGNWNGQQLLSADHIADLYINQIPGAMFSTDTDDPFYNECPPVCETMAGSYSYGFWLPLTFPSDGSTTDTEAIRMSGAFGTTVYISRLHDIVAVNVNSGGTDTNPSDRISGDEFDAIINALEASPTPSPTPSPTLARIAISSDGNNHDCDDITATAMSIALLAKTGNAARLVYYGHSNHIWSSNTVELCGSVTDREAEMQISSQGTADLWGGFGSVFINSRADTAGAISALVTQINNSSTGNPLIIIGAGPMEIIGQALDNSGPNKDHVTVVSHSAWNDNHSDNPENESSHSGWTWAEMQSAFPTVTFIHITDQNAGLTVAESNYFWLRDSFDSRLTWIWDRHIVGAEGPTDGHFDPSDAGMVYWLITGDQNATPTKLRAMLESGPTPTPTPSVTPTPTVTPSPSPTPVASPIPTPTPVASPSPTPTVTPTPTPKLCCRWNPKGKCSKLCRGKN